LLLGKRLQFIENFPGVTDAAGFRIDETEHPQD
jgi:hypothetical protein